jgi:hypothetical protein
MMRHVALNNRGEQMVQSWVEAETAGCDLGDARLNRHLGAMLEALGERPGKSLPTAFQDWSNTKAAYRFFSNGNVSEDKILAGHFAASALRISETDGPILILQDTTEFSFKRADPFRAVFRPFAITYTSYTSRSFRTKCSPRVILRVQ